MRRVEFPFVTGQQEGVDPKVLPVGGLVAARNVLARKDGMLVRRRGLIDVSTALPVGELDGLPRESAHPDVVLCSMDDQVGTGVLRLTRIAQGGGLADGAHLVGSVGGGDMGEPFGDDELAPEERGYAPVAPFGNVRRAEIAPRVGACGIPQVAVTIGGAVATLTMQQDTYTTQRTEAVRYVLELRDPATMAVFHAYSVDISDSEAEFIASARLIASRTRPLVAVVFAYLDADSQGMGLIRAYDAEAPYREYRPVQVATPVADARVDYAYADVLESDQIAIAVNESDPLVAESSLMRVRVMNWHHVLGEDGASSGGFTINTGEGNTYPRGVFAGEDTEFVVLWEDALGSYIELCQADEESAIEHSTQVYTLPGYEIVRQGAVWDDEIEQWNIVVGGVSQYPYGEPTRTSEECVTQSLLWNGSDPPAIERIFYGILPSTAPVAEGGARWFAGEVATGTGLENWAPNFASGVQLIELTSGIVIGQLSPNAGGMDIWSGVAISHSLGETHYVPVGTVAQGTGSRGNALFAFERRVGTAIQSRHGETLISGSIIGMSDGSDAGVAGFSAPPEIKLEVSDLGLLPQGRYLVSAVLEVVDANGRLWRSAPASAQQVEVTDEDGGSIQITATCGKGAPSSGDCFVAFYRSDVNPLFDPPVTQDGNGGALQITGVFGIVGDWELRIISAGAQPNGTAEFSLWRDGKAVALSQVVPTTPFEYAIPDTDSAIIVFENGNYYHGTTYTWSNRLPLADTVLYRVGGTKIVQGGASAEFTALDEIDGFPYQSLRDQPTIYTSGGVLGNDAPPAADVLCSAMGRIWAAGLPDRSRIQASKILVPELGVEWSNDDSFFLTFPEEVVGLASVDETLMVFTTRGIYLVGGGGPDSRGFGSFSSSQRMPGSCGCVSARSIVVSDMGVFYQTARGIEIAGRAFSGVSWIGQGVRDQVDRLPYCWGGAALPDGTVRFLMGGSPTTGESALLVWDQRSAGWYVYTYSATEIQGGRAGLGETLGRMTLCDWSTGEVRREGDEEFSSDEPAYIETGWLRPAGINSDHVGRRLNLLGQFLGPTGRAEVDVAVAFDDRPYDPEHVVTYVIEAGDEPDQYRPGDPIELELTLPKMHFSSAKAKVTWRKLDGAAESVALSGLTMFVEANPGGQRVGDRSKR